MRRNFILDIKNKRGITLVSLVVTIIVLLILTMVSINLVFDTNLIDRTASAKEPNEIESIREKLELVKGSMYVDNKGKSNIDLYLASLDKEKIVPYTVSKTQKFTENIGVVEVDNKYSFLIKFKNNIEIEYEGKIGEIERKEPVIEVIISGLSHQDTLPIILTAEVTDNGEKVTSGKWILNKENEELGTDEQLYTGNILKNESINLEIQETGEYFLHVLTTDVYGRVKETIKGLISVTPKYHAHVGEASSQGGCYTIPYYTYSYQRTVYCYHPNLGYAGVNGEDFYRCYECSTTSWGSKPGPKAIGTQNVTESGHTLPAGATVINTSYELNCGKTGETQEGYQITY